MSGSHGVAAVAGPEGTKAGLRAIRISAAVLAVAAVAQLVVVGVVVAAIGALANEIVARYKMRVGRSIGSEPLIADGKHARIDALASVAAFAGLLGVKLGWRAADPIAGLVITIAIVAIAWDA